MGRNTDKLYVTHSEHSGADGRHGSSTGITQRKGGQVIKRLPFIFCALSLQTWEHPVCVIDADRNATMFDLLVIVPWLQKQGTNPLTGKVLDAKDLIKLSFARNDQGEFCDPVTMKVFNDHTHIVAIPQTGNVYAQDTIEQLNFRAKNLKDLLTDEPFTRLDVITIQDPHNLKENTVSEHVRASADVHERQATSVQDKEAKVLAAQAAIHKFRTTRPSEPSERKEVAHEAEFKSIPHNAAHYTTGYTAASFTNSGMTVRTGVDRAILSEAQYLLHRKKVKTKGLCIIKTNLGNLDIELWPEHAPKAVYNFVKLAIRSYYDNVSFHRNIPGFMIQGGDPTGRGTGGTSVFGKEFEDEISPNHSHDKRGLVCMANKGPNTNSSQFYITYDSARHLDKKHTIFGQVIGDFDTLDALESAPVKGDVPKPPIIIQEIQVVLDPFEEHLRLESDKRSQDARAPETTEDDIETWNSLPARNAKSSAVGVTAKATINKVGVYLKHEASAKNSAPTQNQKREAYTNIPSEPRKKVKASSFGNFASW